LPPTWPSTGALPFGPDGQTGLRKLIDAMTPEGQLQVRQLAGRVWVLPSGEPRGPVARVDGSGARSERRPDEPMAFAHRRGQWCLLAWCGRRRKGRWFRLDRIRGASLTTQECPPRDLVEVFGTPPQEAAPVAVT
jgi:hypothetical protein